MVHATVTPAILLESKEKKGKQKQDAPLTGKQVNIHTSSKQNNYKMP
jgi:hypothetical protein